MTRPDPAAPPEGLPAEGQRAWRLAIQELGVGATLGSTGMLLRAYAEAFGRHREATTLLASSGQLINRGGKLVPNPLAQIEREQAAAVLRLASELGLTPRSRVQFDPVKHCGAKTRLGTPCTQARGAQTGHLGFGRCQNHGGSTPNGRTFAERERLGREVRIVIASPRLKDVLALVDPSTLNGDPRLALQEMLTVSLWREQALRMTAERETGPLFGADPAGHGRAHVLWDMHGEAIAATTLIAKAMSDKQTDDDLVGLERARLQVVADALRSAFDDVGVPGETQDAVLRAMAQRMRPAVARLPAGAELS